MLILSESFVSRHDATSACTKNLLSILSTCKTLQRRYPLRSSHNISVVSPIIIPFHYPSSLQTTEPNIFKPQSRRAGPNPAHPAHNQPSSPALTASAENPQDSLPIHVIPMPEIHLYSIVQPGADETQKVCSALQIEPGW